MLKRAALIIFVLVGVFAGAKFSYAATFVINSPEDTNDGTCVNPRTSSAADCTLREAINAANAAAGTDTINISIDAFFSGSAFDDGDGQYTTTQASAYSAFSGVVDFNAASAWDVDDDRPGFKINNTTGGVIFTFSAGSTGSELKGLEFNAGSRAVAVGSANITVGTDCDGVTDATERNVMHGSTTEEILVNNVSGTKIRGNYLGIQSDGVTASSFGTQAIRITGASADNTVIGYVEGSSGTCSAASQRNVIGGGEDSTDFGIFITSSSGVDQDGDASLAPNNTVVAGNYIGIGSDGLTDIGGSGTGVRMQNGSTLNTIGTDGDGIDDDLEGNVISGWSGIGVTIFRTGYNRVAGNIIGFAANGTTARGNGSHGILARGSPNYIGWCDTTIHASLCANGGTLANERNIVGNNGEDGIRLGGECTDCLVYGNIVGSDSSLALDAGNTDDGIFIHRGNSSIVGGSSSNQINTVMYNDRGIVVDGYFSGSSASETPTSFTGPTENWSIENNVVSSNDTHGIAVIGTEQDGTTGPSDGEVVDNLVENNLGDGIFVEGSSPTIDGNNINDNSGYGLEVLSSYRQDDPSSGSLEGTIYENPTDTLSPGEADQDSVGNPDITNNTLSGNTDGGIYILDAAPTNVTTLGDDNTIGANGSFDVRRDWYAAVELLDNHGEPITTGSPTVEFDPAGSATCTSTCIVSAFSSAGGGEGIWGPVSVDYNDASTWFVLTDFIVESDGSQTDYNPYTLRMAGSLHGNTKLTVDGDASDDSDTGHLDKAVTTAGIDRYQIFEIGGTRDGGEMDPLPAPTPVEPEVINNSTIRWHFIDNGQDETGFRLLDDQGTILVDTGPAIVSNLSFLDEPGLLPATEYCNRLIQTYRGSDVSTLASLPCANTSEAPPVAPILVGALKIDFTQTAYVVSRDAHSAANLAWPLGFFWTMLMAGKLQSIRMRRQHCTGDQCREIFWRYVYYALLGGFGLFVILQLMSSAVVRSAITAREIIDEQTRLSPGDQVLIHYDIAVSGQEATNVHLEDQLPNNFELVPNSVLVNAPGASVSTLALEQELSADYSRIKNGDSATLEYVAKIVGKPQTVSHRAGLSADGIENINSNYLFFQIVSADQASRRLPLRPGTAVKTREANTVYFVTRDGTLRPFMNQQVFYSWFTSFSYIQTVPKSTISKFTIGEPMTVRPGTWLIKTRDRQKVYLVAPGESLRHVSSEMEAARLWGDDWSTKVIDVSEVEFAAYTVSSALRGDEFPDGMLLTDGQTICYLQDQECRPVTGNGFDGNHFQLKFLRSLSPSEEPINYLSRLVRGVPIDQQESVLLLP